MGAEVLAFLISWSWAVILGAVVLALFLVPSSPVMGAVLEEALTTEPTHEPGVALEIAESVEVRGIALATPHRDETVYAFVRGINRCACCVGRCRR